MYNCMIENPSDQKMTEASIIIFNERTNLIFLRHVFFLTKIHSISISFTNNIGCL